jgi:hypothetical protein
LARKIRQNPGLVTWMYLIFRAECHESWAPPPPPPPLRLPPSSVDCHHSFTPGDGYGLLWKDQIHYPVKVVGQNGSGKIKVKYMPPYHSVLTVNRSALIRDSIELQEVYRCYFPNWDWKMTAGFWPISVQPQNKYPSNLERNPKKKEKNPEVRKIRYIRVTRPGC